MTRAHSTTTDPRLLEALSAPSPSTRLRAALAAGSAPHPDQVEALVQRCAVEPDFYVRDMLTWALTRHDREVTTARVLRELGSSVAQARSQALHTLSKLGDTALPARPAVTTELLQDPDDEVARTAWRTAVELVAEDDRLALAEVLVTQLGRGDREVRLSLSRAFVALGEAAAPVLERARTHPDPGVLAHAIATERLMADPEAGFDDSVAEAQRTVALLAAPRIDA
ncbi:HEAT repeat domain-containing protein [Pseudactinotalea suaedae]|uniref:HEAT repeat domain-containing protein n=1 Tax=Pseudactinotalea suaedae TaxID=1524924 RepID=UPI001390C39A|nr:HEAT repeat domain-containing protein [Pseudactinotalea suaedae]